ncbi:putative cysteine desulfurase [Symmachiella dynata]|uniref:Cysteine desulfurase n=1 Tax=Symmachiella dynata TaxID=2527995 RepID=A0A517ZIT9_9PLAN|nr:SufS family cysteine desulfurase [Symmachiella dynata]QDU42386.1 putative cysteine desulfurase [Symmachiella dynata]
MTKSALQPTLDVSAVRNDFPILGKPLAEGRPLIYLDNGATTQKPQCVIDKVTECYENYNANVHRGVHTLGDQVTTELENARETVQNLLNTAAVEEVIFTAGTTAAINLVAHGWARKFLSAGDEILVNLMEHHANLVPWQQAAAATGATLRYLPLTPDGRLDLTRLDEVLTEKTKLVAVTGMSNVLGTINPIDELARRAHAVGAVILVDGAQSVPHQPVDVQASDIDFLAFSGHKIYGPTGIGVLYGKAALLNAMDPFLGGGNMIRYVYEDRFEPADLPAKFEAGTLPIAQAIALGTAIDYVTDLGFEAIAAQEHQLTVRAQERLAEIPGLRIFGPAPEHKGSIVSFAVEGLHSHDMGELLDRKGVEIRVGHHCTMPLHDWLQVSSTSRASFAFYNTLEEVDALAEAILYARKVFRLA